MLGIRAQHPHFIAGDVNFATALNEGLLVSVLLLPLEQILGQSVPGIGDEVVIPLLQLPPVVGSEDALEQEVGGTPDFQTQHLHEVLGVADLLSPVDLLMDYLLNGPPDDGQLSLPLKELGLLCIQTVEGVAVVEPDEAVDDNLGERVAFDLEAKQKLAHGFVVGGVVAADLKVALLLHFDELAAVMGFQLFLEVE